MEELLLGCNHNSTLCNGLEATMEITGWSIPHTMTTFTMYIFIPVFIHAMFADIIWEVFEACLATFFRGYWIFPMVQGGIETLANSLITDPSLGTCGAILGMVFVWVYGVPPFLPSHKPLVVTVVPNGTVSHFNMTIEAGIQSRVAVWFHHQFYDPFSKRFTVFNRFNLFYQFKYLFQLILLELQFFLMDVHFSIGGVVYVDSRIITFFYYPTALILIYLMNKPRETNVVSGQTNRFALEYGKKQVFTPPVPIQNYTLSFMGNPYLSEKNDAVLVDAIKQNYEHVVLWKNISLNRYRVIFVAWAATYITFVFVFILLSGTRIPTNLLAIVTCFLICCIHIAIYCLSPWLRRARYLKDFKGHKLPVTDPESKVLFGLF